MGRGIVIGDDREREKPSRLGPCQCANQIMQPLCDPIGLPRTGLVWASLWPGPPQQFVRNEAVGPRPAHGVPPAGVAKTALVRAQWGEGPSIATASGTNIWRKLVIGWPMGPTN